MTRLFPRLFPPLLALLAGAPAWAAAGALRSIAPGSEEGQNVSRAADFLARMGDADEAREVAGLLGDGKVYVAPPGEVEDTTPGDLVVPEEVVHRPAGAGKAFDPYADLAAVVRLASSLHHARVHLHQSACFIAGSKRHVGNAPHEIEAWESTLLAMSRWVERARVRYEREPSPQALYELVVLLDADRRALADFAVNDCSGAPDCGSWGELKEVVEQEAYDSRALLRDGVTPGPDDGERDRLQASERDDVRQLASAFVPSSAGLATRVCAEPAPVSHAMGPAGIVFGVGVGGATGEPGQWAPGQVEVGYRIPLGLQLGAQVTYGPLFGACADGYGCSGDVARIDLVLKWLLMPRSRFGVWFSVGGGYEWERASAASGNYVDSVFNRGLELFTFEVGGDLRFADGWAVGPFLGISFGDYSQSGETSTFPNQEGPYPYGPRDLYGAADFAGNASHTWLQFGVHGEYLLPLK